MPLTQQIVIGTTANTVAAGNDSRIANAAQVSDIQAAVGPISEQLDTLNAETRLTSLEAAAEDLDIRVGALDSWSPMAVSNNAKIYRADDIESVGSETIYQWNTVRGSQILTPYTNAWTTTDNIAAKSVAMGSAAANIYFND